MSKISDSDTESTYTAKAGGGSSSINIITLPSVPDQGEEGGEAGIGIDGSGQAMVDAEGGPTHEHSERGGTIRHNYSPRAR